MKLLPGVLIIFSLLDYVRSKDVSLSFSLYFLLISRVNLSSPTSLPCRSGTPLTCSTTSSRKTGSLTTAG